LLLARVRDLIDAGRLAQSLNDRYPDRHTVKDDRLLHHYVDALRAKFLRNSAPLARVRYDATLHVVRHALGTHTTIARVQGSKLKTKREIRVASVFRQAPEPFLRMIVVHELAHTKERDHDKAFYALCAHMEPEYHQLEFDVRLWLTALELDASPASAARIR
jgi:predicted metal-dependent hydrolase